MLSGPNKYNQMMWLAAFLAMAVLTQLADPTPALAQALTILDCQGFTRASQQVEPGADNSVQVKVQTPPGQTQPVDITLKNITTGEAQTAPASGGVATFKGISAGLFEVQTTATGVQLAEVTIAAGAFSATVAGAAIAGAAVVGGGAATGLAIEVHDQTSNSGDSSSNGSNRPPPTPAPQPTPVPTINPTPRPTPRNCEGCNPDATPPTLSPFEPGQSALLSPAT